MEIKQNQSQERLRAILKTALGVNIISLLDDHQVVEVMLNHDGKVWADKLGQGKANTGYILNPADARRVIEIAASCSGTICNEEHPLISTELPLNGSRFQGILPPVVAAPIFTIRKKALQVFTLDDYLTHGIITTHQKEVIEAAVQQKRNILIVGGTGSGKTTFANAILNEIGKTNDRVVIIEDTLELQCTAADTVFLRTRDHVTMNDLLKATMRLRPDRIVVGEVRGGEALTLLKAMNTGHNGSLCTAHANDARAGLIRLEQLIQEVIAIPQKRLIAEAINLIVFIERYKNSRRIPEILELEGITGDEYILKII